MAYSFWGGFFGGNPIREIMKTKNYSLEDLLKEDAGQFAAAATSDQELIAFLSTPEHLARMFDYVLEEPIKRDEAPPEQVPELKRRWSYSASSVEAFCQSFSLLSALMASPERMMALFEGLLATKHPLVFHRLSSIVAPMLGAEPEKTLDFIWNNVPNFVPLLVAQVGRASAQDFIPLLKALIKAEGKVKPSGTWLVEQGLIPALIEHFKDGRSDQTYLDTALVLTETLIDSALAHSMNGMDSDSLEEIEEVTASDDEKGDGTPSPLLASFSQEATLDRFFELILSSHRSLVPALAFLRAYLTGALGQDEVEHEPIITKLVGVMDSLIQILRPSEQTTTITLASGSVPAFGLVRLSVLEFLLALTRLDSPLLDGAFLEKRLFPLLLENLLRQSEANVVHDLVAQIYFAAFNRPESYIHDVIEQTDIIGLILDRWELYEKANLMEESLRERHPELKPLAYLTSRTDIEKFPEAIREEVEKVKAARGLGYIGHLAMLANLIAGLARHEGDLKKFIDSRKGWQEFVDGPLAEYNERSSLGTGHNWSIDSDSYGHSGEGLDDDEDSDDEMSSEGSDEYEGDAEGAETREENYEGLM